MKNTPCCSMSSLPPLALSLFLEQHNLPLTMDQMPSVVCSMAPPPHLVHPPPHCHHTHQPSRGGGAWHLQGPPTTAANAVCVLHPGVCGACVVYMWCAVWCVHGVCVYGVCMVHLSSSCHQVCTHYTHVQLHVITHLLCVLIAHTSSSMNAVRVCTMV